MPKRQCQAEVALARLQRNRRRHGAGVAWDIAADDDDGADLGDGAAKHGEKGRELARPIPSAGSGGIVRRREGAVDQERVAIGGPTDRPIARCTSAITIGVPSAHWAMTIALGVNRMPSDPSGPERDSREINGKPDDNRR